MDGSESPNRDSSVGRPAFRCRTFGQLALYRDADPSDPIMRAGKPLALLAYLASAPGFRAERDHVAGLLWPGVPSSDARHSLRQALYRLRTSTGGEDLVSATDTHLELRPGLAFDCLELEAMVAKGGIEAAAAIDAAGFLSDFHVRGSREFEEWAEAHRARFRRLWADAATKVVQARIEAGDPAAAVAVAERLVAVYAFDEEPIQLLMTALSAGDRHAVALGRFAVFADRLAAEGEEPSPGLLDYVAELERFVRHRRSTQREALPFVGRTEEWSVLERAWAEASAGSGSTVLVEGGAGLGKTRLTEELRARVEAGYGVVAAAKCYEPEQSVPYGALAEALATLAERPELDALSPAWLAEAGRLLPEVRERRPSLPPPSGAEGSDASKRRLHQALARCVEAVARHTPVLLALDDLHWGDPASLEVLHSLTHRLRKRPVLVLCTYRPAELSPPARRFARSLCASSLARLLTLGPLTENDVSDLLVSLSSFEDVELEAAVCGQLHRQSGGNPLFLSELLDALSRDGTLYREEGRWVWARDARVAELPRTIGKLLTDRIDCLEPWMRACVECLAVVADEASVDLLARAVGISEPRAELALSVLEEERLTKRTGTETFELIHDEFRRLVYHGVSDERRTLLHAAIGVALQEMGEARRPGGAARLVYHFDQAGDVERARRYALLAAGEASALSAPEALRSHLEMAAAHSPVPLPPRAADDRAAMGAGRSPWRRPLLWAAAGGLATVAVVGTLSPADEPSRSPLSLDFRVGELVLRGSGSQSGAKYRLVWPPTAGEVAVIEALGEGSPPIPDIRLRPVTRDGETHDKLFWFDGADTIQLTFGRSDDSYAHVSPDGGAFVFGRGWRSEEHLYTSNLYRMRVGDHEPVRLTDTRYQDLFLAWSPTGTRFAFARDSLGSWSTWVSDADGQAAVDLTRALGLPDRRPSAAFSPDGTRIAVLSSALGPDGAEIHLADLREPSARRLVRLDAFPRAEGLVWSPDGRWLAFQAPGEGAWFVWAVAADGSVGPLRVVEIPGARGSRLPFAGWLGERRTHVDRVVIQPDLVQVDAYAGVPLRARALTADGADVGVRLRWSVSDTIVARVDDSGFLRGRAPGRTWLIASAGGARADTVPVVVDSARLDTLMIADWSRGIEPTRWRSFGNPRSLVLPEVEGIGTDLFTSNGDYNHSSGILTRRGFVTPEAGLTVEAEAWLGFTGDHWQSWGLELVEDEPEFLNGLELVSGPAGVRVEGHSPAIRLPVWTCGVSALGEWSPDEIANRWIQLALQVRPDGVTECFRDGRFLGLAGRVDTTAELGLVLSGATEGADIFHGTVVVLRGLKY